MLLRWAPFSENIFRRDASYWAFGRAEDKQESRAWQAGAHVALTSMRALCCCDGLLRSRSCTWSARLGLREQSMRAIPSALRSTAHLLKNDVPCSTLAVVRQAASAECVTVCAAVAGPVGGGGRAHVRNSFGAAS